MKFNFLALVAAALIPLILATIWYHPALGGRALTPATARPMTAGRTATRIGLFLLFGAMLALALIPVVIHQSHLYSILAGRPKAETEAAIGPLMERYGREYRSFKHGAFHGTIAGILIALPLLGITALVERRAKTVLVHAGYWVVTLALMGGVVCGFL